MTTERWREIERVFEAMSERPAEQREARLRQECVGDDDLRREVHALVACDATDDRFAKDTVQAAAESLACETSATLVGRLRRP